MSYGPASPPTTGDIPHSPRPRMFEESPTNPSSSGPKASDIMQTEDYKNLRFKTTVNGTMSGIVGGGVLTALTSRFAPNRPSSKALTLLFLLSSSGISFLASQRLLSSEIASYRMKAQEMSTYEIASRPQSANVVNSQNKKYLGEKGQLDWGAGDLGSGQVLDEGFVGEDRGGASSWGAGAGK